MLQQRIHPAASRVQAAVRGDAGHASSRSTCWPSATSDYTQRPFERAPRRPGAGAGRRRSRPIHLTPATRDHDLAEQWFAQFEGAGLDGVVAKPLDGTYQPDKRVMFKIKHERTADCVVAGYRVHKSGPDSIGSLLLGLYNDDRRPGQSSA